MPLELRKPLIVFDVESTGLSITADRIIELSYVKLYPNGERESRTMRFNPERPIPADSTAVHHITDADVAGMPTFKERASDVARAFDGCDVAGFNSNHFDIPILFEEMIRAGKGSELKISAANFVDVQAIFHKKEKRDLEAAYRFYCGKEMENHHSAECDALTTLEVLLAQVDRYDDLPKDIEGLAAYSRHNRNVDLAGRMIYDDEDKPVFNFGKYRGKRVEEILTNEPGYYGWFMHADFPQESKNCLTQIKLGLELNKRI